MELPRVLVAGTGDAIAAVQKALEQDAAHLVTVHSLREALDCYERETFDVIACSVRFDESRMFEFLQELMLRRCQCRIIAFRSTSPPLPPSSRAAIRHALEALGVQRFIDLPAIGDEYGDSVALEALRKMVLEEDFTPPAPAGE